MIHTLVIFPSFYKNKKKCFSPLHFVNPIIDRSRYPQCASAQASSPPEGTKCFIQRCCLQDGR